MASKEVAFVLVPGAFSQPTIFNKLTSILDSKGHTALPTQLQSAVERSARPPATFKDDVDHIHDTIAKLLEQDKDVVLVMNSYGGFPGTEAAKGLSRAERGQGNGGALIKLVYLASFVPPVGSSLFDTYGQLPGVAGDKDDGYRDMATEADGVPFADLVFNDLPAEQRQAEFNHFVNQSGEALHGKVTCASYQTIPAIFVLCEQDRIVPPEQQRAMIDAANADGANIRTIALQAGHCPMVSQPETTAQILLDAAAGIEK